MFVLIDTNENDVDTVWEILYDLYPSQEDSFKQAYTTYDIFFFDTEKRKILFIKNRYMNNFNNELNILSTGEDFLIYGDGKTETPLIKIYNGGEYELFDNLMKFKQYRRKITIDKLNL